MLPLIIGMSQCVWSGLPFIIGMSQCVIWSQITSSPLLLVCHSVCDLKSDHLLPFIIGMSQCVWSEISPLLLVCHSVWSEVRSLAPLYYWYITVCVIWNQITCSPLLLVCNSVCDLKSDHLLPFIIGMSQCVWSEVRSLAPLYYWYVRTLKFKS